MTPDYKKLMRGFRLEVGNPTHIQIAKQMGELSSVEKELATCMEESKKVINLRKRSGEIQRDIMFLINKTKV